MRRTATRLSNAGLVEASTGIPPLEENLAQLFRNRSACYGNAVRWQQRVDGVWLSKTWRDNATLVNSLIAGLDALGARPGDSIGILSGTRWEWMAADWAILGIGGVTVTIYPSNVPETIAFMLNDANVRFLFVEDRSQYDKLLSIRHNVQGLRKLILFTDAEQVFADPWVISFSALQHCASKSPEDADELAQRHATEIQSQDPASIVYTSGTTGQPKGVIHTHATLLAQIAGARTMLPILQPGMVDLLFLPLAHVLGREEHFVTVDRGMHTVIAPSIDHLADELRAAQPELFMGVPRVFEKAYVAYKSRLAASNTLMHQVAEWAMRIGNTVSGHRERHEPVPLYLSLAYWAADQLVFRKVRAAFGGRLRFAISGGAPLDSEILHFFHAAGVLLLEGWGLTETGGALAVNRVEWYRMGTVGQLYPDHEVRIASDGEILVRGPCVFSQYQHNASETAAAFDPEGWFRTGDIGRVDADGFLRVTERKKDLIATAGGKKIAPQMVEQLLDAIPCVSHAAVFGDRKPYLVALIALDDAEVQHWAQEAGIAYRDPEEIATHPRFRAYLDIHIARVNAHLARYETVKRYAIVPEDFTADNGLLTPTLKIRRRQIAGVYHLMIEHLYQQQRRTLLTNAEHPEHMERVDTSS